MNVHETNYGDRSLLTFVFFYSLGRFIKLFYPESLQLPKMLRRPWVTYAIVTILFFFIVAWYPALISKGTNFLARAYNTIGVTVFAVLFFLGFQSIKIQSSFINVIAKSTFAIYLIHGNNIVTYHRWIYNPYSEYGMMINNIHLKLLYLIASALIICAGCILIDRVRLLLFNYLGINWFVNKMNEVANKKVQIILNKI